MKLRNHDIAVCNWSLQSNDLAETARLIRDELKLSHVHLSLAELLDADESQIDAAKALLEGIEITAGMIHFPGEDYSSIAAIRTTGGLVPDDRWPERGQMVLRAGVLAGKLGIKRLTTHIGFIPRPNEPGYASIVSRVNDLAGPLAEVGVDLLMETGQETATELLQFMNDLRRRNVGVNFDPANMLLYGNGDPLDAISMLGKHIRHVHVKDAVRSSNAGIEWGTEVRFGDGDVPHAAFIAALERAGYEGPLAIEREAGDKRVADVKYAIETLQTC